jgi:hypothetical protein
MYSDQEQLDNTGYRLAAGLDWETIERLSGTVSLISQRHLARYGTESTVTTTERNVEDANQFDATVQYGGQSILTLYGLYGYRSIDYSLSTFDELEYKRHQFGAGVRYRVGGALLIGGEVRIGQGEYPLALGGLGDDFDRRELAFLAQWEPTGASRIRARLSATDEDHEEEARDFSGLTGGVVWDWRPTGKLRFETELRRDTGQESDPLLVGGVVSAVGSNSEFSSRLQVRAYYQPTAKIEVDGLVRYTRRKLIDTITIPGFASSNAGHDNTLALALNGRYYATRTIQLGCAVGSEDRNADSNVSYSYRANVASCYAQILLTL